MLKEVLNTRQQEGQLKRRWFSSRDEDLIVWYSADGKIFGFQLCYDRQGRERALTWNSEHGFAHNLIDDGETVGMAHKQSPILVADGLFDAAVISRRFCEIGLWVPKEIMDFVAGKLAEYPERAAIIK